VEHAAKLLICAHVCGAPAVCASGLQPQAQAAVDEHDSLCSGDGAAPQEPISPI
jgi:hypothetical protein